MAVETNAQGQLVMRECIDMSQGDVILRCQDGSVPCHKVVLAALSPAKDVGKIKLLFIRV